MARHYHIHDKVYQELDRLAARKATFTTSDLRQALGFPESGTEAATMHNVIVSLKKAGIVKSTDSGRRRNQYLYVDKDKRDELKSRHDRIRRLQSGDANSNGSLPADVPSTPRVVKELKQKVDDMESQLEDLHSLSERFEAVESKVQELYDLWS